MKSIILKLSLLTLALNIYCETVSLSLNDAISLGLKNNLDIKTAKLTLDDSRLSAYTVWNKIIPGFSVSGSTGVSSRTSKGEITKSDSLSGGMDLSLSINAKNIIGVYEAINDYKNGKTTFLKANANIRKEIAKSYYSIVLLKEELSIKELAMKTSQKRYNLGLAGYKTGEIGEIDKLRREYSFRAALYNYDELKNKYDNSILVFLNLIGLLNNTPVVLSDSIPEIESYDLKAIKDIDINKHIGIENVKVELGKSRIKQITAISVYLPSISLGSSFSASYKAGEIFNPSSFDTTNSLRLSLSIPLSGIFPFTEDQVSIIKSENNNKRVKIALEKERIRVEAELITTLKELEYILSSYKNGSLNVGIAKKVVELTEIAYNEGTKEYIELISVEEDYQTAQLKQLQNRSSFTSKILDLEYNYLSNFTTQFNDKETP